jgi:alanyl aminopeptidase
MSSPASTLRPVLALLVLFACASTRPARPPRDEQAPSGRLPRDVRPLRYSLDLTVLPHQENFSGVAEIVIALSRPRDLIYLHANELDVREATVAVGDRSLPVRWEKTQEEGVAAVHLPAPVGPGEATLRVRYEGRFSQNLHGLYRVRAGGRDYAFTQFEDIDARRAFPSFDEPAFKTPFALSLTIPEGEVAIANTPVLSEAALPDGKHRFTFSPTLPLSTYLVAFAVGPFDVVDATPITPSTIRARPVPLRGVAVKGRGPELAYALRHTGPLLSALERYFGVPYPYEKLDLIAVPDFAHGAMENAGAITFRDSYLLIDEKTAPLHQLRGFARINAHELAHQWFGNLVTMEWWDDVWLNEAFATWMGTRIVDEVHPEYQSGVQLLEGIDHAMEEDSRVHARQIRQPIESNHDIANAFDGITYVKGAGVLAMFERYLGPAIFQAGIRRYLETHREKNATADHLLAALAAAAGRDVATPFKTFLLQPGVPLVKARLVCESPSPRVELSQSRFLPVGSSGERDRVWQLPLCLRFPQEDGLRSACTLLTQPVGQVVLAGATCPAWVLPNADAAGYFRFSLPSAELARVREGSAGVLTDRERVALAISIKASFAAATLPAEEVLSFLVGLAGDAQSSVVEVPMDILRFSRDWLVPESLHVAVDAYGRSLFKEPFLRLTFQKSSGDPPERQLLRTRVVGFLALDARDASVRAEAARRGRAYLGFGADGALHPEAVDPELAGVAVTVAVQDSEPGLFDGLIERLFASEDAVLRDRLLSAIGSATAPALSARALALSLDPRLKKNERAGLVHRQLSLPETREAAWGWLKDHHDALVALIPENHASHLPFTAAAFCDSAHMEEARAFFGARAAKIKGAPRNLANALEALSLCIARRQAHQTSAEAFFRARGVSR